MRVTYGRICILFFFPLKRKKLPLKTVKPIIRSYTVRETGEDWSYFLCGLNLLIPGSKSYWLTLHGYENLRLKNTETPPAPPPTIQHTFITLWFSVL